MTGQLNSRFATQTGHLNGKKKKNPELLFLFAGEDMFSSKNNAKKGEGSLGSGKASAALGLGLSLYLQGRQPGLRGASRTLPAHSLRQG